MRLDLSRLFLMTDCVCGNPEGTNTECERCVLLARIAELESLALDEIEAVEEWAVYASEYFRVKHRLDDQIKEFRQRLTNDPKRR